MNGNENVNVCVGVVVIIVAPTTHACLIPFFHHQLTVHIIYDPNFLASACNNFGQHYSCNHIHEFGELLSMQVLTFCFIYSFLLMKFISSAREFFPSLSSTFFLCEENNNNEIKIIIQIRINERKEPVWYK